MFLKYIFYFYFPLQFQICNAHENEYKRFNHKPNSTSDSHDCLLNTRETFHTVKNGKNVVVAYIPEAQPHEKPVFIQAKGLPKGAFRRIGSTDQHCTDDDVQLLYQNRNHHSFDETNLSDCTLDDLDPSALAEYRRNRAESSPTAPELSYSDDDLLISLLAVSRIDGRLVPTIAGLLLFGKRISLRRHFPMTRIDYIRVPGSRVGARS